MFGAGILVGLLEEGLFGQLINPWVTGLVQQAVAITWLEELLVGPYGLWTMGMTYALALILPIVTTFFLAFGVLEDSGYLPRLAALSNRLFKTLGLNGKAVLPMVLGLGCVTMAMLPTGVLESKRDRLLVTLLLALAVPCSAQLGVVMGMLAGISLAATLILGGVVLLVMMAVGWLAARLIPGERTMLLVELPPLRLPSALDSTKDTIHHKDGGRPSALCRPLVIGSLTLIPSLLSCLNAPWAEPRRGFSITLTRAKNHRDRRQLSTLSGTSPTPLFSPIATRRETAKDRSTTCVVLLAWSYVPDRMETTGAVTQVPKTPFSQVPRGGTPPRY